MDFIAGIRVIVRHYVDIYVRVLKTLEILRRAELSLFSARVAFKKAKSNDAQWPEASQALHMAAHATIIANRRAATQAAAVTEGRIARLEQRLEKDNEDAEAMVFSLEAALRNLLTKRARRHSCRTSLMLPKTQTQASTD